MSNQSARIRVAVMYGGRSGEHEVSLRSAHAVIDALDPSRYEIVPVAITKDGRWRTGIDSRRLLEEAQRDLRPAPEHGVEVTLPVDPTRRCLLPVAGGTPIPLDVVFPVLHGTYGEDGTIQGLFELADLPYVGAGVLASAVGMDKEKMKRLFEAAGLPVCRWIVTNPREAADSLAARVANDIGYPCFVKPANLGSSVGISKVKHPADLAAAVSEAQSYDPKVVIEEGIDARELECAVLGNDAPEVSVVGEVIPSHEFYDYADKYLDSGSRSEIPAKIEPAVAESVRAMAARAFEAIECSGLARVDFFLERGTDRVVLNEINTMPGCTAISLFPKAWEASGKPLPAVVDRLIELAFERHDARARRRLSFESPRAVSAAPRRNRGTR